MRNVLLILFLIIITTLSGCNNSNDNLLESEFIYKNKSDKQDPSNFFDYNSSANEFQIDGVEIDFYIGIDRAEIATQIYSIEKIQLYAQTKNSNEKVILTEIIDFEMNTFEFEKLKVNKSSYKISYKYSINVKLPTELFKDTNGEIEIGYLALSKDDNNEESAAFQNYDKIYYKKVNGKIILLNE
jgi:hypothetical protein